MFQNALIREEGVAHFAALNKIREAILIAATKDIENGGDGKKYLDALKAVREESSFSQEIFSKISK